MKPDTQRTRGFFADKNRAFWLLQGGGWVAYFFLRTFGGLANGAELPFILPALIASATGFSLTLLMSAAYRRIIQMRAVFVWSLTLLVIAVAASVFSVLEVWAHSRFYDANFQPEGVQFFGAILLDISVLGAWSGLYFGINFYLMLSHQNEDMLKVQAQASEASLAMLRYQVNPHFLFNTLNSISTLVLLKDDKANAMLSRLSSFLRYSLAEDPGSRVTLAQELEALKLYFDIERMRFENRLQTSFDIDARAADAAVPSMILQPLVENAIKYAVTPQEEGAEIAITARLVGNDRVFIDVADTGPGLQAAKPSYIDGAGVGLNNIRERLAQQYGGEASFMLAERPEGGVVARLDIPYQTMGTAMKEAAA
ncbi:histidine kinase [Pacificimonas sp. WHA3]|uniref:Histidine kinase n=1 Tax=Pacificimonas pallii TaxID=2827236 RepID=A0ABS6SD09_9SPHN|nr:histidine kinase [Pacificimonas pallii]MBV7256264.1 histidine kinase [Pacificimonas pallii]